MSLDQAPYIPGRYLLQALASGFLREDSESRVQHFLNSKGLTIQDLENANSRFPVSWISHLIPKNNEISPLLLALKFGDLARLTSQGDLSLVLMTSANVRESLHAARYLCLHSNAVLVDFKENETAGYLLFDINSGCEFTDDIILYYSLAAIRRLLSIITNQTPKCSMKIMGDKPIEFDSITTEADGLWEFNQPTNCLVIEKAFLDKASIFADPLEHAVAIRTCEESLAEIKRKQSLPDTISDLMINEGIWDQDLIAERLHMSKSTLKRRLSSQGTTFSGLANKNRKKLAIQLLTASDDSLLTIAERLGYSDQSNFSHAFKKWFDIAPREFMASR